MKTQQVSQSASERYRHVGLRLRARQVVAELGRVWPATFSGIGLFGLFMLLVAFIQFATPNLIGNDGYFHIKFAQVMRQQGLHPPFPWLPLTILNADAFYDHHFLYHVLLIPFTFGDLRLGAKWASVVFPSLAFLMGWLLLRSQRVPYAALWSLGFFAMSEAFLRRMLMPRVQSVSLLMLFLILYITLTKRHRWLLPLSFTFIWLYDAFPLIFIVVGSYVVVQWILEGRLNLRPVIYTALGVVLGLLINPYFPNNVSFIYHHFLPKLTETTTLNVGGEWYPYQTWTLIENSGLTFVAFVAGTFALGLRDRRMSTQTATLFLISVVFGLLLFKSRRFVEYYPAFTLLFCALAWAPLFNPELQHPLRLRKLFPLLLALVMAFGLWYNITETREEVRESTSYQRFAEASAWLRENSRAGSRVFQTDWDDFTWLYFNNSHNTYTLGLDPTYMQTHDADLYELWRNIANGWLEKPGQTIYERFEASYVLTDLTHEGFLFVAWYDPYLEEVYRDDYAVIYRVHNEPY